MVCIRCSLFENGENEAYRKLNLRMVPWGLSGREQKLLQKPP